MRIQNAMTLAAAALLVLAACAPQEQAVEQPAPAVEETTRPVPEAAPPEPMPLTASATLQPKAGTNVGGTVTFTQEGDAVRVDARFQGVAAGTHGFHLHETGDCSAADFTSAGAHFNPGAASHGAPTDATRHAGDLGNIEIAADGTGSLSLSTSLLTVAPGPNSAVGKAVILHEKADDFKTQPTGDAGGRIACGVVQAAAEPAPAGAELAPTGAEPPPPPPPSV
ncbi:MAG TPA: superoxide dismutase family protein [Thermoanaerobaculia bacterium]|nr:superoxide dismutase family protein [Thermoanaerobaculia bacterium]